MKKLLTFLFKRAWPLPCKDLAEPGTSPPHADQLENMNERDLKALIDIRMHSTLLKQDKVILVHGWFYNS